MLAQSNTEEKAWKLALDEYESHLVSAQLILTSSNIDEQEIDTMFSSWTPPTDIGPIPPDLRSRAQRLAETTERLVSEFETRVVEIRGNIARTPRTPVRPPSSIIRSQMLDLQA